MLVFIYHDPYDPLSPFKHRCFHNKLRFEDTVHADEIKEWLDENGFPYTEHRDVFYRPRGETYRAFFILETDIYGFMATKLRWS